MSWGKERDLKKRQRSKVPLQRPSWSNPQKKEKRRREGEKERPKSDDHERSERRAIQVPSGKEEESRRVDRGSLMDN